MFNKLLNGLECQNQNHLYFVLNQESNKEKPPSGIFPQEMSFAKSLSSTLGNAKKKLPRLELLSFRCPSKADHSDQSHSDNGETSTGSPQHAGR